MHVGTRVIVLFITISVIWLFVFNVTIVSYFENTMVGVIVDAVAPYARMSESDRRANPVDFLVVSDQPLNHSDLVPVQRLQEGRYYYIKRSYMQQRLNSFGIIVFGLESSLFLSLVLFTYMTVARFVRDIEGKERFLNLLLLSFNHKIGNFLSTLKINVEILKDSLDDNACLHRIEQTCTRIEADMKRTFKMISTGYININEVVDVGEAIEVMVSFFGSELSARLLLLDLRRVSTVMAYNDLEDILYNLIDNAIRYSVRTVGIRLRAIDKHVCIYIRNDIAPSAPATVGSKAEDKGTGLGKEITLKILKRYRAEMIVRQRQDSYFVCVRLPLRGATPTSEG
ncbi:MAG: HAMP domain-containing histidine kinase [Nitrospirae bacterium]|nr:HAMP domain-containing histidine kinase [Nitrospirota bacterium]MBF0590991.1 HAMP domain-containing histidine kinase [Nitrospirota bacterium]